MAADTATRSPERSKTTRGADDEEREAKKTTTMNLGTERMKAIPDGGDEDGEREGKRSKTINPGTEDDEAAAAAADEDLEEVDSPLREPYIPKGLTNRHGYAIRPEIQAAFQSAYARYQEKQDRMAQLPTDEYFNRPSCLSDDPQLLPVRDVARNAVLSAAKFVIRLSSSVGGKPLTWSAGFWIDWDEQSKTCIVLTTANLVRSKKGNIDFSPMRYRKDEYDPDAEVIVHLLDDTTAEGRLLYYQEHYGLALFKVGVPQIVPIPSFTHKVNNGQEAFRLGRDESLKLMITHGRVEYLNPNSYEGHHYMYFSQENDTYSYKCDDDGGPVIDFDGNVLGIVNNCTGGSFIPYSILRGCLDLWRNFRAGSKILLQLCRCIPRPHLGLTFESIKFVDPIRAEYLWRKLNIDDGLIVEEVSTRSPAEKNGIRTGDIIERINGEQISTTIEMEKKFLSICKGHFDKKNGINGEVDFSIQVFHTGKRLRRTKHLTVMVSELKEVVERAYYPITTGEGFSGSVPPEQVGSDK